METEYVYWAVRTVCSLGGSDSVFTARFGQCVHWAVRTVCLLRGSVCMFKYILTLKEIMSRNEVSYI